MVIHTKGQRASLVTADISDATQALESVELADDDVFFGHLARSNGHGEGEDGHKGFGDDSNGRSNAIQYHLVGDNESSHREHDNDEQDGKAEEEVGELGQFDLEGCTRLEAHNVLDFLKNT